MQKTTVYLEEASYSELKRIGRARGRAPAELVREAVTEYAAKHAVRRKPRSIGSGRSGNPNLAANDEDYLTGMGEDQ